MMPTINDADHDANDGLKRPMFHVRLHRGVLELAADQPATAEQRTR